ncbi:hypothetical protein [Rugosimonospora africana]|uniref:Peptidase n=1 Tax=Rugosimonospora africana TaxID=556532 RepID=A0A8J3QSW9_9ACTN|nr:hypothetical protein [Rugosimonospora africana]GIH16324.1 hypothetical protein Raf01_44960 [Rugosimonospora africana]
MAPARQAAAQTDQSGSFGIQLLDAPTDNRSDPRALKYIVDHLTPGTVIHRRVLVVNKSTVELHVAIYPAAASVDKGGFQFAGGRTANELVSWINASPSELDLAPGAQAPSEVTIQVPTKVTNGERYAVVWASVTSGHQPSANVTQVYRVGVRVYLDVGPGGDPPSDFAIGRLVAARNSHGQPSLSIAVHNTGQRALDLSGQVTLTDGPAGTRAGPFRVSHDTTLGIGQSGTVTAALPRNLPDGPWTVRVDLASGLIQHSVTQRLRLGSAGHDGPFASLATHSALVWSLVVVIVILVAGAALTGRHLHRTRRIP